MTALRLTDFAGMIPVREPRSLPDNAAAEAVNVSAAGSGLRGLRSPALLTTLLSTTKHVYRIPTGSIPDLSASYWMQFADENTDVVRTPVVNDSFERYYWASPSTGLKYATKANILAGGATYNVGVPAPTTGPRASFVTGTGKLDPTTGKNVAPETTRVYVMTFVSIFGEESGPSPVVEVTGPSDGNYLLNAFPAALASASAVPIQYRRIYRTITAQSGVTEFYRVDQITVETSTYLDLKTDNQLISQLESTLWAPPPALQGLALMPNGILVGWTGNTLYFSERFRPHAWPAEYALTVEHPIVGLGVYGNTCVVCTSGRPAAVTGVSPASMSLVSHTISLPCVSRKSIISTPDGVLYATESGVVLVGPAGMANITDELIGRETWQEDYRPSTLRALALDGAYIGVQAISSADVGFMFYPARPGVGVSKVTMPAASCQVGVDLWSGKPWLIQGSNLYEWMKPGSSLQTYRWRSKEFTLPRPANLAVAQLFFDRPAGTENVTVRVWADGVLKSTQTIDHSKPFRLPAGFKATIWQFELESSAQLHAFVAASTVAELRDV